MYNVQLHPSPLLVFQISLLRGERDIRAPFPGAGGDWNSRTNHRYHREGEGEEGEEGVKRVKRVKRRG